MLKLLGVEYFNTFKVDNLMLQLNDSIVYIFTFHHVLNYANANLDGAFVGSKLQWNYLISHYRYKRWYMMLKLVRGNGEFRF
jgi:hypothetical protein